MKIRPPQNSWCGLVSTISRSPSNKLLSPHQCSPLAALSIKFPIGTLVTSGSPLRTKNECRGVSVCGSANSTSSSTRWAFRSSMRPIAANLRNGYRSCCAFLLEQPRATCLTTAGSAPADALLWRPEISDVARYFELGNPEQTGPMARSQLEKSSRET